MNWILVPALLLFATAAQSAPIFTLDPPSGSVSGSPGSTVGWGFRLQADADYWTSIIGVVLLNESNPALGQFTDFISPQGGPTLGVLAPGAPDWVQTFDESLGTGFGAYTIDPSAMLGIPNDGQFLVLYELYSDDPNICGGTCFADSGALEADFSVTPVPEPASYVLAIAGLLILAGHAVRAGARSRT